MFNFTYQNHLKYSIGNRNFGCRENGFEKFIVDIGIIDRQVFNNSTYKLELNRISNLILEDLGKDLIVFLSGGTDSEIVLRSFLDIGFKPKCVTIKFKDDYNILDVKEAVEISRSLDIDLEILNFDVKDFYFSGKAEHFAKEIQCTQITYLMVYYHVLQLSAPSVMGGELLLTRHIDQKNNFWYYTFRENEDASAMRFSNRFRIPLVNEYFSYTPEIMLHFLDQPLVKKMLNNPYKLTSVSSKNQILEHLYPGIRPKVKTHGFEKLLAFNYQSYKNLIKDDYKRLEFSLDGIPLEKLINKLKYGN